MSVQLILREDVEGLGRIGDEVHVSAGYARNFLLPRKLAEPITKGALRRIEAKKLLMQKQHEERINVAKAMADKIAKTTLVIPMAAGENDKLYGSVGPSQIAEALLAHGIEIERNIIVLDEPIRELGSSEVEIKLHSEVKAIAKVKIVRADDKTAAKAEPPKA
ncbi:MAG TPA: 50S ribosomal protein L9 [Lentisphaeria bacterium]|nr:50S ribosomal protein L9 [Lentisphaerota bacterium]OQC13611.1 MAG: 50S ribosomal protein L9 [Lentisphaerae bacterium ADurb.Bin082]HPY90036.1 50S ribosomal protein L9 [Lentisphaeria bacterium]HQC51979.1 50S ribosomal protein L9 [Lentisphaeria bacterium]HQL87454.1 50S ribosomal protein L9 [Lentisphaeria bacterium]